MMETWLQKKELSVLFQPTYSLFVSLLTARLWLYGPFLQLKCKAQLRLLQVAYVKEEDRMREALGQSCCYATDVFDSKVQKAI